MAAPPAAAATIVENATLAAEALDLDEADTRRLIGAQLRLTEGEADSTELTSPEEGAPPVDGMRWKLGEKMTIYNVRAQTLDTVVLPDGVAIEIDSFNRRVVTENFIRPNAIFTRDEVERLISDPRLLEDRRVLYAVKGLAGLRHGEAARLRFTHYDPTLEPLGALDLEQTKTQVPRRVPVHPTLARMLAEWKLAGWERTFGRAPRPDDLIVPTRNMTERQSPRVAERVPARSRDPRSPPPTRPRPPADVHHARPGRRRPARPARDDHPRPARGHHQRLHDVSLAGPLRRGSEADPHAP